MIAKDKLRKLRSPKKGTNKEKSRKVDLPILSFCLYVYRRPALNHVLNEKTGIC